MIFNSIKNYFSKLGFSGICWWVVFVIMGFALIRACHKEQVYKSTIKSLSTVKPEPKSDIIKQAEEISRKTNEDGKESVIYELAEPIIKEIVDNTKLDSLAKDNNIKAKEITAYTSIAGTLKKENTDLLRRISELSSGKKDTSFVYEDRWFSAEGFRSNDSVFTLRNIVANVGVEKIDHIRKKYWLFGRNEDLSTVYYSSPYIRVDGLSTLRIKKKDPLLNFSVDVDAKYLHAPQEVLIGPSVGLDIGRFGVQGGYYLNPGKGDVGNTLWYGLRYKVF